MASQVQEALDEVLQSAEGRVDELEGLEDVERLNIRSDTRLVIEEMLSIYRYRRDLDAAFVKAAEALLALPGYPLLVLPSVTPEIMDDLQYQSKTVSIVPTLVDEKEEASAFEKTDLGTEPK